MPQKRTHSAVEAATNLGVGMVVSWVLTFLVLPLWGLEPTAGQAVEITAVYTVASFVRSYAIRRVFSRVGA